MKPLLVPIIPALFPAVLFTLAGATRAADPAPAPQEISSQNNPRLRRGLESFPEADTNKDGVLTLDEARTYLRKLNRPETKTAGKPASAKEARKNTAPDPSFSDVKYGPFERNVLDFWKAPADHPAPVVVFIHGGGFRAGDKSGVRGDRLLPQCLAAGVSFAAINYRYRTTAPLQDVLRDCARAIQFIRSKADEWHVDKSRIASYGGSAGAGTSLWLAFHDDLADPQSSDPVLRESTRLSCVGANACQFSYDILEWPKLFGEAACRRFGEPDENWPGFYGLKTEGELNGPVGQKIRHDCDMCGLIRKGAPPVFLSSTQPGGEITDRGHYLHHPKHAEAVRKRCDEFGVECVAQIPGLNIHPAPGQPQDLREFLFLHLGVKPSASSAGAGQF